MKFYILIFALFGLLLIGKTLEVHPTTKPPQTELDDKCPANTFEPIKLTGSFNSIKTDSVKTDKLNFPSYSDLLGGKPKNYGTKK